MSARGVLSLLYSGCWLINDSRRPLDKANMCPVYRRKNRVSNETPTTKGSQVDKNKVAAQVAKIGLGFAISAAIGYAIKGQSKLEKIIDERMLPKPTTSTD